MNTGSEFSVLLNRDRSVKKGDLFRVIEVNVETNRITLAAIDDACLRDNEMGVRKEKKKKPKKQKKPIRSPKQKAMNQRARIAWKKRSVVQCIAIIDKEDEECHRS